MIPLLDKLLDYKETVGDLSRAMDRPAYLLTGEELFLVRQVRDRLVAALLTPGSESMDLVRIAGDGKPASFPLDRLLAEMATPPFLSSRKVICIQQSGLFSAPASAKDSPGPEIQGALTAIPAGCTLIFVEESVAAGNRLLKAMRKAGALSAKFDRQTAADLELWISGLCGREKLKITREAADSLISRCDRFMSDIYSELTNVLLYCRYTGKEAVGLSEIDFLCREDLTGKIFDLTDAIAAGRTDQALGMLDVFLARREAPLYIQTMLARQTRDLLLARECASGDRILASGLTQSSFYARKLASQARRFSTDKLEKMLEDCFQLDLAVKTGRLGGEDALSILVIRACLAA
ncbi:MAG: DNA polymerase III subunit delta [Saccharofermentanales bacterium]